MFVRACFYVVISSDQMYIVSAMILCQTQTQVPLGHLSRRQFELQHNHKLEDNYGDVKKSLEDFKQDINLRLEEDLGIRSGQWRENVTLEAQK